jgi:hypothetical protein
MKAPLLRFSLALALCLTHGNAGRADPIGFSYHWSMSPSSVLVGTSTGNVTGNGISTGNVAFALAQDGSSSAEPGGGLSAIPAASLTTSSTAPERSPDSFASPFSMTLHLTDTASGQSADLSFAGVVNGTLTATASTLEADFSDPLTRQVTLGGRLYSVTIDPSSAHIPAPGGAPALLDTLMAVSASSPPPVQQAPEPSTLVLVGGGVPLAVAAWRRWRAAADEGEA